MPPNPDSLRAILTSRDPDAISRIAGPLVELAQSNTGPRWSEDDANASSAALELIGCDLGLDCGPTSTYALNNCVMTSTDCRKDWATQRLARDTPAFRQAVERFRTVYAQAILSGDYTVWRL